MYIYINKVMSKKRGPKKKIISKYKIKIKRQISQFQLSGEKVNSTKIRRSCNLDVSSRTIQRYMSSLGMKYKKAKSQLVLSKKHKDERIKIISRWISDNQDW